MRPISVLCFLHLLLLPEASPFTSQRKLAKLQNPPYSATESPKAAPPIPTTNKEGRVLNVIEYGADPGGVKDSSDAVMKALSDAFQMQSGVELLRGVSDLGGAVLQLQGGTYKISKPIRFPAGAGNLLVEGGTLRASETFPGDRHLIELWSPNSQKHPTNDSIYSSKSQNAGIYYEDVTFRDILLDSSFRGGGIFLVDSARTRINNCFFLHFTTEGILVQNGHETFVSSSFLGQRSTVGGDSQEREFSGTAIDLAGNDNAITDVTIFSAAIGIKVRGQANIITGVHCYNKASSYGGIGIITQAEASLTRIDNCYLDFTAIVLEDPTQVHVTNGLFLGDANVILKSVNGRVLGLNVVDNMFNGDPGKTNPIVVLDGDFKTIDQVVIERNNVQGMKLKSTAGKLKVEGNGTKWVADFSSLLVFPNRINHFQYSFFLQETPPNGLAAHAVTNVSHNVVVVESEKAVNAVVSVIVDQ